MKLCQFSALRASIILSRVVELAMAFFWFFSGFREDTANLNTIVLDEKTVFVLSQHFLLGLQSVVCILY